MAQTDDRGFLATLESLKVKVGEFTAALSDLYAMQTQTMEVPELEAERQRLLGAAGTVEALVNKIGGGIDTSIAWLKDMLGIDNDNSLGFLPVVPILGVAGVTAAVSGITYWLTDYLKFMKKFEAFEQLKEQGVDPGEAWELSQKAGLGPSFIAEIGKSLIPIALIGGMFYLIPKYFPQLKKW